MSTSSGCASEEALTALIDQALLALGLHPDETPFLIAVDALVDLDGRLDPEADRPETALARRLLDIVGHRWEQGWQPLDLLHLVRRGANARSTRLAVATVQAWVATCGEPAPEDLAAGPTGEPAEAVRSIGADLRHMPRRWLGQLDALGVTVTPPAGSGDAFLLHWRRREGIGVAEALELVLKLANLLGRLTPLAPLDDPPSLWGPTKQRPSQASSPVTEAKLLSTIRALLAKAESTPYPAEAETFTAKAQDFMSRHAIDAAVLAARRPQDLGHEVSARRVHIEHPYAREKCALLGQLAGLNSSTAVWSDDHDLATIVGFSAELDLIELLFTSLLIQATRAASSAASAGGHTRSPSFRRAFYVAYAQRIGERLGQVHQRARQQGRARHGAELVPILVARSEAVAHATERLFPATVAMGPRQVNAEGWAAGRQAADRAQLPAGRTPRESGLHGPPED